MKRMAAVLLLASLLLSFAGCMSERYDLLYETTVEGLTYAVRGTDHKPRQLAVKRDGEVFFAEGLDVDKRVGSLGGSYGLEVVDLNFDGSLDVMLPVSISGDCLLYTCYVWDASVMNYVRSEELSGLCNLRADAEGKYLLAFSQEYDEQKVFDGPSVRVSSDIATQYVWEAGMLIAHTVARLTHYESEDTDYYCYELSYFDPETGSLGPAHDKILTPEEYKAADFGFLYYFK